MWPKEYNLLLISHVRHSPKGIQGRSRVLTSNSKGEQWVPSVARTVVILWYHNPCPPPSSPQFLVRMSCGIWALRWPSPLPALSLTYTCHTGCREVWGYSFSKWNGIWSLLITHSGRKPALWGWGLERTCVSKRALLFAKQVPKCWSPHLQITPPYSAPL